MTIVRLKTRNVGKVLDAAFGRLDISLEVFEVEAALSLAHAFEARSSTSIEPSGRLDSKLIALHPAFDAIKESRHYETRVLTNEERDILLSGVSSASDLSFLLGALHQWSLASALDSHDPKTRKKLGAYYTPKHIVHGLLRDAWPLLNDKDESTLNELTFCDPACGAGQFIVTWIEELKGRTHRASDLVASQFFGVDLDPVAIWLCRISVLFAARSDGADVSEEFLLKHFRVGNSLLGATWEMRQGRVSKRLIKELGEASGELHRLELGGGWKCGTQMSAKAFADAWFSTCLSLADVKTKEHWLTEVSSRHWAEMGPPITTLNYWASVAREYRIFHWFDAFPDVALRGGFDFIIGNPPYVNSIELEYKGDKTSAIYQDEDRTMRGSADLAYQFLRRGLSLVRDGGSVYFLMPRATFAAPSLRDFWASSRADVWLRHVVLYDNHRLFEGASIFVSGALWHRCGRERSGKLSVVRYDRKDTLLWRREVEHTSRAWWSGISAAIDEGTFDVSDSALRIRDEFDVSASMTTGEFYDCREFLDDGSPSMDGIPMITSGAIDPGLVKWGQKNSRILGRDYLSPQLQRAAFEDGSPLKRRRERAERPKILIAGLAARVEAVFLEKPSQGAVSTLTITHPHDDVKALEALSDLLNSDWVSLFLRHILGANALGGGNITISKDFVRNLPLQRPDWRQLTIG